MIFKSWNHFGDNIEMTAVAHNYYDATGQKMVINPSIYKQVYSNNPYVELTSQSADVEIHYAGSQRAGNAGLLTEGFTKDLARILNKDIPCKYNIPQLYTPYTKIEQDYVVIQAGWYDVCSVKNISRLQWQELIDKNPDIKFKQVGILNSKQHQPMLYGDNVQCLVNKLTISEYFNVIHNAKAVIGSSTSCTHVAAAYNIPCLCVIGNRQSRALTAYPNVTHCGDTPPCGPCMNFYALGGSIPKSCNNVAVVGGELIAKCLICDLSKELHKLIDVHASSLKVGYVITTYGTPAYVQMQIKQHKQWNHDIIVADDGSHDAALIQLCARYNVPLLGVNDISRGHQHGDWYSTIRGLEYFKGYDWVVKLSRRCIWLNDKQDSIAKYGQIPLLTDWWVPYNSYGNKALHTSCIAFNMHTVSDRLLYKMKQAVPTQSNYVQKLIYQIYSSQFNDIFSTWSQIYICRGRQQFASDILWKTRSIQDYKQLGNYTEQDLYINEDK